MEKKSEIIRICDTRELEKCFKKYPKNRSINCKDEIKKFEEKCSNIKSTIKK